MSTYETLFGIIKNSGQQVPTLVVSKQQHEAINRHALDKYAAEESVARFMVRSWRFDDGTTVDISSPAAIGWGGRDD